MRETRRLEARAVMRILAVETGGQVGWLYRWNNGDLQPAWFAGPLEAVIYEPV